MAVADEPGGAETEPVHRKITADEEHPERHDGDFTPVPDIPRRISKPGVIPAQRIKHCDN
ncbi:hypothetical protein GCM10022221_44660 [Actinocorallia aurea]